MTFITPPVTHIRLNRNRFRVAPFRIGGLNQYRALECIVIIDKMQCSVIILSHQLIGEYVMTQISTSVQQTAEVVALMLTAVTLRATSLVPVNQDTLEMDLPAQVSQR